MPTERLYETVDEYFAAAELLGMWYDVTDHTYNLRNADTNDNEYVVIDPDTLEVLGRGRISEIMPIMSRRNQDRKSGHIGFTDAVFNEWLNARSPTT